MASKNSIKTYIENGYYHIYNRGVEKRKIFMDKEDYSVFLHYLKTYLLPKDINFLQFRLSLATNSYRDRDKILREIRLKNFFGTIDLMVYCLMPNHFHLLLKQSDPKSINSFMNALLTRYGMYFNKKYKRVGPLFQDVYKAVNIQTDEQLAQLSLYIHKNPWKFHRKDKYKENPLRALRKSPSSLSCYIGEQKIKWINTTLILPLFGNSTVKYKNYIIENLNLTQIENKLYLDS